MRIHRRDGESSLHIQERGADVRACVDDVRLILEARVVLVLGDACAIEVPQARERLADRERDVNAPRGIARDAEFQLRGAVAVAADEEGAFLSVVEDARGMCVGGDVFGTATRARTR